jgi:hypothetical protein
MRSVKRPMRSYRKRVKHVSLTIFALAIVLGLASSIWVERRLQHDLASLRWPHVTGSFLQSEYLPGVRRYGGLIGRHYYYAAVTYHYRVDGISHLSHTICLWNPDLRHDNAADFVKDHPVGSLVEVYYDPLHPEVAVLMPGAATTRERITVGGGILCAAAGACGLWLSWRIPEKAKRHS